MDDNYDDLFEEFFGERPEPVQEGQQFIDLDDRAPLPFSDGRVEILNDAKDEFEVDGATTVFSTLRVEGEDSFDVGDIEIFNSMHARTGRRLLA